MLALVASTSCSVTPGLCWSLLRKKTNFPSALGWITVRHRLQSQLSGVNSCLSSQFNHIFCEFLADTPSRAQPSKTIGQPLCFETRKENTMFKMTAIFTGIGLALSATAQADYRWEVAASASAGTADSELKNTGNDQKNSNDTDVYGVEGTYFLKEVDTSKGPLGEAAFLDHASYITLGFSDGEVDLTDRDNEDGQTYNIQTRYVAEGPGWQLSGWLVDLGYERAEPGDREIDTYNVGIGKYLTPNTTVVLDYKVSNLKNGPGSDLKSYGASLDHFFALNNDGGVKVRAAAGKTVVSGLDDPTTWGLGATWYISKNLGFGADFEQSDYSGYETNGFKVNAEWFITEDFAVDLSYTDIQPDDIKLETGGKLESSYDEISIGARYRF